ncbi:MAG: glycosyltransferase [Phycisphaerales bacterium]
MNISVVIPTYNRSRDMVRAIESCLTQLGDYDEIVVVDDGSTDDTAEVLQGFVDRLPGVVRAVRQDNAGVGAARNTGFEHAAGDYILVLDSDDLLLPWAFERLREAIDRFDKPAIITSKTAYFENPDELDTTTVPDPAADVYPDLYAAWRNPPYMPGSGVAMLRSALDRVGDMFTHRHLGEDADLFIRFGRERGFVVYHEPFYAQHRPRSTRHTGISMNPHSVYRGAQYLLQQRAVGAYGPSTDRGRDRDAWVTATTRPSTIFLAKNGYAREAMDIYKRTLGMNISLGRWRYVLALPMIAVFGRIRPAHTPPTPQHPAQVARTEAPSARKAA